MMSSANTIWMIAAGADVAANCSRERGVSTVAVCAAATGPVASICTVSSTKRWRLE